VSVEPQPSATPRPRVILYLESRYRKLVRGLPQTIFYCPKCKGDRYRRRKCKRCDGYGKLTIDSVQELIARPVLSAFRAKRGVFHGAGREDIDVRMLGDGRPFVFEVVGARELEVDLDHLRQRVHDVAGDRIEIAPLRRTERKRVVFWKESKFDKVYGADVELGGAVDPEAVPALVGRVETIRQRTPQRVARRRADRERERQVTIVAAEMPAPETLRLELRCAHGTYVKEWISGDEGRTRPALADMIGTSCRCVALDVLKIMTDAQ